MKNSQLVIKKIVAFVLVFAISLSVVSFGSVGTESAYAASNYSMADFWKMLVSFMSNFNEKEV